MAFADFFATDILLAGPAGAANAVGATDGVYTTDTGSVSWTGAWDVPVDVSGNGVLPYGTDITGLQTVRLRVRPSASGGNAPTLVSVTLRRRVDGIVSAIQTTTLNQLISNFAGVDVSVTFPYTHPANGAGLHILEVEIATTGSGGGPSARRSVQLDSIAWAVQYTAPVGSDLKYWDGAAWQLKPLKYWDGGGWLYHGVLREWNGFEWAAPGTPPPGPRVVIDGVFSSTVETLSTHSFPVTVNPGTNRALIVFVAWRVNSSLTDPIGAVRFGDATNPNMVTAGTIFDDFNNVQRTADPIATGTYQRMSAFIQINPPVKTDNVIVSGNKFAHVVAISLQNVDQINPVQESILLDYVEGRYPSLPYDVAAAPAFVLNAMFSKFDHNVFTSPTADGMIYSRTHADTPTGSFGIAYHHADGPGIKTLQWDTQYTGDPDKLFTAFALNVDTT